MGSNDDTGRGDSFPSVVGRFYESGRTESTDSNEGNTLDDVPSISSSNEVQIADGNSAQRNRASIAFRSARTDTLNSINLPDELPRDGPSTQGNEASTASKSSGEDNPKPIDQSPKELPGAGPSTQGKEASTASKSSPDQSPKPMDQNPKELPADAQENKAPTASNSSRDDSSSDVPMNNPEGGNLPRQRSEEEPTRTDDTTSSGQLSRETETTELL